MSRRFRLLPILITITLVVLSSSGCRPVVGLRGTPWIAGVIMSFLPDSTPEGFMSAGVYVFDDYDGSPIGTASVSVNGTSLVYNAAALYYQGNPSVAPGESVTLNVGVGGKEYSATGLQFNSYPTIMKPEPRERWAYPEVHEVDWTTGTSATPDAAYELGVLDAYDPNGPLVWPDDGLKEIHPDDIWTEIPGGSLGADECVIILGVEKGVAIPEASRGSGLIIGGYDCVPVTVIAGPGLVSIDVSPEGAVRPVGASLPFSAAGRHGDLSHVTLTSQATWNSSAPGVASVESGASNPGLVTALGPGTTEVSATVGEVSGSQTLTVSPWRLRDSGISDALFDVAWSGSEFVAVGAQGNVLTSPDGIDWTKQAFPSSDYLYAIAWSGSEFVAVAGTKIWTSQDGESWTNTNSAGGQGVVWSGSQFVVVGGTILTSPDGVVWTAHDSAQMYDVAWSGARFVAVGAYGKILTSPDGITWTQRTSGTSDYLQHVAWSGSQFVVTGGHDILTSVDGVTWTAHPSVPGVGHIIWNGSGFVGVGGSSYAESSDGNSWTSEAVFAEGYNAALNAIAWDGTQNVIVGSQGVILTSVPKGVDAPSGSIVTALPMATPPAAVESVLQTLKRRFR